MENPSLLRFLVDMRGEDTTSLQLRDDLMTMLIAGHETTAAVLTWTFFELSQQPALLRKVQLELDTVLGGRAPNYDDILKLPLLRLCLAETLRMYPEPPLLIRRALDDDYLPYPTRGGTGSESVSGYHDSALTSTSVGGVVGGQESNGQGHQKGNSERNAIVTKKDKEQQRNTKGVYVPKGTDVFISTFNIHRSEEYWKDPLTYNPERFLEPHTNPHVWNWSGYSATSLEKQLYPNEVNADFAFLPFGGGSRKCVGMRPSICIPCYEGWDCYIDT